MSEKKITGSKLLFWLVTGVFVTVCSIVLMVVPGFLVRLLTLGGNIGGTILFLLGGILLIVFLIITGVSALWGTKQSQRWRR